MQVVLHVALHAACVARFFTYSSRTKTLAALAAVGLACGLAHRILHNTALLADDRVQARRLSRSEHRNAGLVHGLLELLDNIG